MNVILFEDQATSQLSPIVLGRPAYAILCGGLRLLDIAQQLSGRVFGVVRDYLEELQGDYLDSRSVFNRSTPTLLLNARLVPDAGFIDALKLMAASDTPGKWCQGGEALGALLPSGALATVPKFRDIGSILSGISELHEDLPLRTLHYPHEVVAEHIAIISRNLKHRLASETYREVSEGLFVDRHVRLPSLIDCDTTAGPILVENGAKIGPFCALRGPIALGANVVITPHALLKGPLSLGNRVKVGGEVSASIIEANSNKCHYGYIGHAYVGSWVNLGAGTTNSNLKNTYGSIRAQYGELKIDTGMQFFGCVIGDYTKTAINTSIFTGKVLGVCSNVYGFVTTNVPSFANYARGFGEVTELPPEVMEVTQRRVFERRGIEQRPCDVRLIRAMYDIESKTRELANHPPTL